MEESSLSRTPVTIITGFLGAGKTTLLNRILSEDHGIRIAVIENEFASLNIDSSLIEKKEGDIIEMKNGCICCDLQGELQESLIKIASRREMVDHVLIETTGLANPSPLVQTLLADPLIHVLFELDSVITLVDSKHFSAHWKEAPEFKDQISFADLLLLNKVDLCIADEIDQVESYIRTVNPISEMARTTNAAYPIGQLFQRRAYDNDTLVLERRQRTPEPVAHEDNVSSLSLEIHGALEEHRFMAWFEGLLRNHHDKLYRTKGIIQFLGYSKPVILQGVHAIFQATLAEHLRKEEISRLVFIGKDLDRKELLEGLSRALPPVAQGSLSFASSVSPDLLASNRPLRQWTPDPRIQLI